MRSSEEPRKGASKLRVLYVHHRPEDGGAPRSLAELIRYLNDEIEPAAVCPPGAAADMLAGAGVRVLVGPVSSVDHTWRSTYRGPRAALLTREAARLPRHLRTLAHAIDLHRPHVVHLNEVSMLPAAWMVRRRGVPIVCHARVSLPDDDHPDTRAYRRALDRWITTIVAINDDVARSCQSTTPPQVVMNPVQIPSVVMPATPVAKERMGLRPDLPVVGMLSNLYPAKGWRDLVAATGLLRDSGREVQVLLAGAPIRPACWYRTVRGRIAHFAGLEDTETELAEDIERLQLKDLVHVVPFSQDIGPIYEAVDIVAFPSRGPEVGRPVLEGQAWGRPVITSGTTTGAGVIIDGQTGLLHRPCDPASMVCAIERLLNDPDLAERIGAHARRWAETAYSPTTAATQILETYRRVAKDPGCAW